MEEVFDIFDRSGNFLGTRLKSFCHSQNPGVYHKPVWIWLTNSKKEILVQRRSKTKKWYPEKLDGSATGHVVAGESPLLGAVREIKEELGIDVDEKKLKFVGEFVADVVWEIGQVFFSNIDAKVYDFQIDKNELEEVFWLSFNEFKKVLYSDNFMPYEKDYKDWIIQKLEAYFAEN